MSRRALLAALALGGCGFRPVYGPSADPARGSDALAAELAAVRVGPIGERSGQLLRRYLQRRLEGSRPGTPARYTVQVSLLQQVELAGFRPDGLLTRFRITYSAPWVLSTEDIPPVELDRGVIRTIDAYDIPDLQFFASESAAQAVEARVVDEIGDRVVNAVALALRRRLG